MYPVTSLFRRWNGATLTYASVRGIGISAISLLMAFFPAVGYSHQATIRPFIVDGSMKIHDWKLSEAFSDEFGGTVIDENKWNTQPPNWGRYWVWGASNAYLKDGRLQLKLEYRKGVHRGKTEFYVSGIIESKKPIRYGYYEARIRASNPMPGTCAAFWLGGGKVLDESRYRTEIDILEAYKHSITHIVHVFKHPDAPLVGIPGHSRQWYFDIDGGHVPWRPSDGYHIYGLEWTPRVIRVYVDGELQGSIVNQWWHNPLILILSLGLRQPYLDDPTPTGFPAIMSVDYVRVWKSASVDAEQPLLPKGKVNTEEEWKSGLKGGSI